MGYPLPIERRSRAVRDLWREWFLCLCPAILLVLATVFCQFVKRDTRLLYLPVPIFIVLGLRVRSLGRLTAAVRGFPTISCARATLHYPQALEGDSRLTALLLACEEELDDLANRFGFAMRRRLVVYLFADHEILSDIYRRSIGGTVAYAANAVLLALGCQTREILRHELVHLFAARWNMQAPPILQEGLATWLQREWPIGALDRSARLFQREPYCVVEPLNGRRFIRENGQSHFYLIAGSFTAFLIRRFGWERYRQLYTRALGFGFRGLFQRCFGVSLQQAEQLWREEMLALSR